jgi:hypothetical protein
MPFRLRQFIAIGCTASCLAAAPVAAQELAGPAGTLVIAWRSPAVPQMPTVTWTIEPSADGTAKVTTEARALFERMRGESTMYRALFTLRATNQFGFVYQYEFDRAQIDPIGKLEVGKSVRIASKTTMTGVNPQTKAPIRQEVFAESTLTIERAETIEVPAGKFETFVIRLDAGGDQVTPSINTVVRRYWYAPALGWYVRHEMTATGPGYRQHNEYVAVKITRSAAEQ